MTDAERTEAADKIIRYAAAYLAERDETAIDRNWLLSVGFVENDFGVLHWYPFGPIKQHLSWAPWKTEPWFGEVAFNMSRWLKPLTTRGDLRTLCRALGIELKEPT
jgi:hypothetical protein